ncbi:GNAT family N-acetyltransferase [Sphingomonas sp. LY160]|uniref:GNAT family N-acetyltransferase n=1 Tax=Sphingomonas sp. LY160 TaxID=3095342 RepID=UPI002ADEAA95|nr:GNAT family N-acetyltransferase [Sphingomonas sp. LY160]MEA1071139.1 GNAT family N-acetyltransferase [Sphingomonas sp. LY160]
MSRSVPIVETERLILRTWRKEDFRPYHQLLQHPDVHRHFGPTPMSVEECWRRILAAVGGWTLNGFGTWAVERKSDSRLIGNAGLFTAWRGLDPEFGDEPEMGWIFDAEVHGQGLAGEACRAVLDWAERTLPPTPVWAIIAPANTPSIKLAERLGFEALHQTPYHGEPTLVLRRPAWS